MSRVVQFTELGGPEVLKVVDVAVRAPKSDEVRIQVKAIGLNRAEAMYRAGNYLEQPKFPAQLGYEAAGIIESIGEGVTGLRVGDAVSTVPNFSMLQYGMYGDLVVAPVSAVTKHPSNLSFVDAASIWMMYVTAYDGLVGTAKLQSGDTVLIPAASSSVGLAAIQITNMIGATSIALTRTSAKADQLKKAGAAHVIATEEQDVVAEVKKITGGKGATVTFDPVGGPTFAKLVQASAPGARLVLYGVLSDEPTTLPLFEMIGKLPTVTASIIMTTSSDPEKLKVAIDFVNDGLKSGKLTPVIAKTFPIDKIADAHRYLEANQQFGKIVVTV